MRVGYVWAGSRAHRNDKRRSTALEDWSPVFAVRGVQFVCLQLELIPPQWAALQMAGHELPPPAVDWLETANRILTLDLVIAVDTAVVHLAGALDVPAWVLLAAAPDYRWGLERDTTPWYGSVRLYRQAIGGDWRVPIARVAEDLAALAYARRADVHAAA